MEHRQLRSVVPKPLTEQHRIYWAVI
jgi:hypothetical protein